MPTSERGQLSISISVSAQRLDLLENGRVIASWPVSTSKFGLGTEPGSFRTPTGRFVIAEAIGGDAAPWTVFKSRVPTGEIATPGGEHDGVLTRILWLDGLDPENTNTRDRYVYIHGTNQESLIGTPASHGCVRMRNADVIELFDRVAPGTPVQVIA
ncbi:MAG: L,D-transpeptidase family protein [Chthoniobacterales bacterium]